MSTADQSTAGQRIAEGLREAIATAKGIGNPKTTLAFTFEPTGHRVKISGDFISIEIVRKLIEEASRAR